MASKKAKRTIKAGDRIAASSVRALADLLSKGHSTVRKWTKDSRWPFPRYAPYTFEQVRLIRGWARMYLSHNPAAAYQKQLREAGPEADREPTWYEKAKLRLMVARGQRIDQQVKKEAGLLHRTDECLKLHAAEVHRANAALQGLGRSLANALVGQDADGIEAIIETRIREILKDLERGDEN